MLMIIINIIHMTILQKLKPKGPLSQELRLQLREHEMSLDRLTCEVNGTRFDLGAARSIESSSGASWLIVDAPPLINGENRVLVLLEGIQSPRGWHRTGPGVGPNWPTVEKCELLVFCFEP